MHKLENLGFSDWFEYRLDADMIVAHEIVRVLSVHKDNHLVTKGLGEVFYDYISAIESA